MRPTPVTTKKMGRPRKDQSAAEIYDTPLYRTLLESLPMRFVMPHVGRIDTGRLAEESGMARFTFYRWFAGERMRPSSAKRLIELSNNSDCERKGQLTIEKLTKFIVGI